MKKWVVFCLASVFLLLLTGALIRIYNQKKMIPTKHEEQILRSFYGDLFEIRDSTDILSAQKFTIENIIHKRIQDEKSPIIIDSIIDKRAGFCYDRSMLLQKLLLANGFELRPVYLYYTLSNTGYTDFFNNNLDSHTIIEIKFNNDWYIVQTNHPQTKMKKIDEYIIERNKPGMYTHYIRYLNNRHGGFIQPKWIPDIY